MTSPYRGGPTREASAVGDDGLVDDLVRQFADRFAFLRELVQNSIDAGATSIEVELREERAGEVRVSVIDDGEGMDADIVENALLVLFRSTKEGASGKIGKFGVGFVSVFAVAPRLVVVETKRDGNVGLVLELHPDHRYELFEDPTRTTRGTAVRLHVPASGRDAAAFAKESHDALARWCRHAALPIHFRSWLGGDAAPAVDARIDGPFELDALVTAHGASADGTCRAIVGLPADGKPSGAFFNHGLTLFETDTPMAGTVSFKVQGGGLGHTLSRDNVRRDEAFRRAMALVDEIASGPLVAAATCALEDALAAGNRERYGAVLDALLRSGRRIDPARVPLPLAAPCGGAARGTLGSLGFPRTTVVDGPSEIASAVGSLGIAVVDAGPHGTRRAVLEKSLFEWLGKRFDPELCARATRATPAAAEPADAALLAELLGRLDEAHRRPLGAVIVDVVGAASDAPCCAANGEGPWVLFEEAEDDPFRLFGRRTLLLNAAHPAVASARRAAATTPKVSALLLARVVLLRYGALHEGRCAELGDAHLAALAAGGDP